MGKWWHSSLNFSGGTGKIPDQLWNRVVHLIVETPRTQKTESEWLRCGGYSIKSSAKVGRFFWGNMRGQFLKVENVSSLKNENMGMCRSDQHQFMLKARFCVASPGIGKMLVTFHFFSK